MLVSGYIKLFRSLVSWEWYDDINVKTLFIHLLLTVNYKPKQWQGMMIEVGQRVTSLEKLSSEVHLSVKQTRVALDKLKSSGEISTKATNKFTLITVENYTKYQLDELEKGKQKTNKWQTEGKQRATMEESNKNSNKNINNKDICTEPKASVPEKMQADKIFISLPLNDKTEHEVKESEVEAWKELYPVVNIEQELRNMKGWLNANPTKRKTKKGINRFMNSWLSREQDKGYINKGGENVGKYGNRIQFTPKKCGEKNTRESTDDIGDEPI